MIIFPRDLRFRSLESLKIALNVSRKLNQIHSSIDRLSLLTPIVSFHGHRAAEGSSSACSTESNPVADEYVGTDQKFPVGYFWKHRESKLEAISCTRSSLLVVWPTFQMRLIGIFQLSQCSFGWIANIFDVLFVTVGAFCTVTVFTYG